MVYADGDFERLADGLANRQRDFDRRLFAVGREVEIAFVNRSLLHVRCEVVGVAEHPVGKLFLTFVVAGQHDELRAKLTRPRRRYRRIDAKLPGFV